jgi:LuxR family maltose regulon positive regulatory protein
LNEGLEFGRQITLVSAPAGFGKTTCISEWVNTLDCPVTWLSLDPADDDPGRFFAYLVAALQKVDANLGREIESVLHSGQLPPGEAISTTLSNDILELEGRFLLVLDDFQVIQDRFILQVFEKLVANLPQPLHLVLLTREDPPLPLARLRANNQLTEIRAGDLRFTSPEADRFLNEVMGLSLSPADIAVLDDKTEGWIVGLQLAGLSVRDRADPSSFIATLSGSHRFILSYLTEGVLNQQPEEIRQFLLQTSILDRLSGDLCNVITGRSDSHLLLEQLFHANLFLIPLDDEQWWYRYHHLFADLLSSRLHQTLPANAVEELHCRASEWLARNDLLHEAITHALEGRDYETAASLVEQEVRTMMFSGRVSTLKNWLEAFPEASFQTHPRLNINRVWIDLLQGKSDLSEQALQEKENMLRALPPSPENDQLRVELMMILCRFVAFSGNTSRAIRLAEEGLACLPEGDLASRARAHSTLAIAYGWEGQAERARRAYDECLHLAQAAGNYSLAAHATVVMAMGQCDYGQLHEAARSYQSIIDMGVQAGQKMFFPAGQGYIGLAGIHLEWNDLETAKAYLKQGMELCSQGGQPGIFTGHTLKSRLRRAEGDLEGALEEIHSLGQTSQGIDPAGTARQILLRLAMGDLDEASRLAMPLMNMLSGEPATTRLPLLVSEITKAILIRVFLAQGEFGRAMQLLDEIQATAEPGRRFGRLIEVYLLRALAQRYAAFSITAPASPHTAAGGDFHDWPNSTG